MSRLVDDIGQAFDDATCVLDDAIAAGAAHWARTRPGPRRDALWDGLCRLMAARGSLEALHTRLGPVMGGTAMVDRLVRVSHAHDDLAARLATPTGWLAALPELQDGASDIEATLRAAGAASGSAP